LNRSEALQTLSDRRQSLPRAGNGLRNGIFTSVAEAT
jgi:hypothetical protein